MNDNDLVQSFVNALRAELDKRGNTSVGLRCGQSPMASVMGDSAYIVQFTGNSGVVLDQYSVFKENGQWTFARSL